MTNITRSFAILFTIFIFVIGCQKPKNILNSRLNEIQIIGSHNSYKIAIDSDLWRLMFEQDSLSALSLQYEHVSLTQQLDLGLRSLEIDVFHDPQGGRFTNPLGLAILAENGATAQPFDLQNDLEKPGLKVFHVQDFDFRSHNLLFKDNLKVLKKWSDENENHIPVIITINTKDEILEEPGCAIPLSFTKAALDSIDLEIRSVFDESRLVTPALIKGHCATLEQAILENGWPKIKKVKGRFFFVLDEGGKKRVDYLQDDGNPNRVMFVNVQEGHPEAAIQIINDPIENQQHIQQLVIKGYMVRTRADAGTLEARENSADRFNFAMASKAQIISTDYYIPSRLFPSEYKVIFEGNGYTRFNELLSD